MSLIKFNNIDELRNLEYVFQYVSDGIFVFTTKTSQMQKIIADELSIWDTAILDFSNINAAYSYAMLFNFAKENEHKRILIAINFQNVLKNNYDIINLNLSRDMIACHKKIWIFGMTLDKEKELSLKARDFYSYVRLKVNFEDEIEQDKHMFKQLNYDESSFIDPKLIDDLLENYNDFIENEENAYFLYDPKQPDAKNISIANSFKNIGDLFKYKNEYEKAIQWYRFSLNIYIVVLGEEHPNVVDTYISLAEVYRFKGCYDEALDLFNKALVICEKTLGKEHLHTASLYDNLARVYKDEGDYCLALEFYYKSLKIKEKLLGFDHPLIAICYNNLGLVYQGKEDFENALKFYKKALIIREKTLGLEHPSTAIIYNNLAGIYKDEGNYDMAVNFYNKALKIYENVLGLKNPSIAIIYNNLAKVYEYKGNHDMAIEFHNKALEYIKNH